jgi:branched-chain amino acid aminotransferase
MKPKPTSPEEIANLKFGQIFSDHMIEIDWTAADGWTKPRICPIHDFQFHPATKVI